MLHVHHAAGTEVLLDALADVLRVPPDDPLAIDHVAVHSRGFERWLAQGLSLRLGTAQGDDGISAAIEFPFPGRLVADILAAVSGLEPDDDPWPLPRLTWHLLALLEQRPDLADDTPLARHLAGDRRGRLPAVRRLADHFDRYGVHRPALLRRWAEGPTAAAVHADGRPLPARLAWQAGLWRALRDHVEAGTGIASPAERLPTALAALRDGHDVAALPRRLALFGLTALPASHLDVLQALATHREVHLFLAHPSPVLWARAWDELGSPNDASAAAAVARPGDSGLLPTRDLDPTRTLARHPLLRSWARDAREMTVVLASRDIAAGPAPAGAGPMEPAATSTLLGQLQQGILTDQAPAGRPLDGALDLRHPLDPTDHSIEVHACHGARRQVEVLRDRLLARFAADPTLQPRDVVVLCPDVDTFAPLLEAVFPRGTAVDPDPERAGELTASSLRVRVADRSPGTTNPLLHLVTTLLGGAESRFGASEVLDLAARLPVRARFGFDDADLDRLAGWTDALGVRWGIDAEHRADHGVPTGAGTWAEGLERLLLGIGMADEGRRTMTGVVPLDDVADGDVDLVGRCTEFVIRLDAARRGLIRPRPLNDWCDALRLALDALTDVADEPWQRLQVERLLDGLVAAAGASAADLGLHAAELRALVNDGMARGGSRADQRTGDLTVSSLVPMRSVPHRVVCLVGLDDGSMPRRVRLDGDDVLERDERVGDRDPRTEDRQLLLDAVLAAREALLITYAGHDERTGDVRPPAVPVGELLDVLDRTACDATGRGAGVERTVVHPLHAVDPRNFRPDGIAGLTGPVGADPGDLAGARARQRPHRPRPGPPLGDPLAPVRLLAVDHPIEPVDRWLGLDEDARIVELDALLDAVLRPIPSYLDARLDLRFPRRAAVLDDELMVELVGLDGHAVGDAMLEQVLAGAARDRAHDLLRGRNALPPGELATAGLTQIDEAVDRLVAAAQDRGVDGEPDERVELDVALDGGLRLVGTVDELVGTRVRRLRYSRLRPAHRLAGWLRVLALTAAEPEVPWSAVTIGRVTSSDREKRKRAPAFVSVAELDLAHLDPDAREVVARRELETLVSLARTALRRPLPIVTGTSSVFAEALHDRRHGRSRADPRTAGRNAFEGTQVITADRTDPAIRLVLGGEPRFAELLAVPAEAADPPLPSPQPASTDVGLEQLADDSRFGRLAQVLWNPMLDVEERSDR